MSRKFKYFLASLFVMGWLFFIGPSYAQATENNSSEQVIVSPDQTISSAETAIINAETTTSTVITEIQNITNPSEAVSGNVVQAQEAIQDAQEALTSAQSAASAVESATTAVSTAQEQVSTAQSSVSTAQTSVQNTQSQIETQTATVATNQIAVNTAQAAVNAATTPGLTMTVYSNPGTNASPTLGGNSVGTTTDTNGINENWGLSGPTVNGGTTTSTETFTGNRLNTDINITVNGTQVSTTNNNGVYIGSIGWPGGSDPSLSLYSPSATTTILMPANTISAGFSVFAKNGNTTGTITYTDGTSETYTLQHNVSSEYPNYVHQEVFTAPAGKKIANVTIPTDWDYFAIDNVSATKQSTTTVSEDFQVKWSGYWTPQYTGTQYVYAPADDGVKLYLDGELVIDDWVDKGGGGSTADIPTIAGTPKTFEMWYYENGGGANVSLQRYTGSGWEVIPESEFSKTVATTEQRQALATANSNLQSSQTTLSSLQQQLITEQQSLASAQQTLSVNQSNLTAVQATLSTAQTNLTNSIIAVQTAVEIMNNKVSYVQNLVSAALVAQQYANLSSGPSQNQPSEPTPEEPPAEEPPAEEPPAEEPPAEEPPAEEPPAEEPPAEEPPAEEPPAEEPPAELTVEEIQEAVSELIEDGAITQEDVEAVLEALSADGEISTEEVINLSEALSEDGVLTLAEKDLVAEVLVESAEGAPIEASAIEAAGLEYRDLPPQIPVEVREDANGNPVVITAEVASALLTLESPAALVGAIAGCFNPDEAIEGLTEEQKCEVFKALANIGADMSPQERQKAKEVLVAAVLVGQVILGSSILRIRG